MNTRTGILIIWLMALLCVASLPVGRTQAAELILCGGDEVFIIDIDPASPPAKVSKKIWSWRVTDSPRIPASLSKTFRSTDECKPVADGKQILITSSSGGVALIERATKKALFWAYVGNAHSAEMLPGDRIVVAGSTNKDGNCVALFDTKTPEKRLFSDELTSGHGVVWDDKRQRLYALGLNELRVYKLKDWNSDDPKLQRESVHALPDAPNGSGHDLVAVPDSTQLALTSAHLMFLFDRDRQTFKPHPQLHRQSRIKGIAIHPQGKGTAYTQGNPDHWWTDRLQWIGSDVETVLEGERLYKARWMTK